MSHTPCGPDERDRQTAEEDRLDETGPQYEEDDERQGGESSQFNDAAYRRDCGGGL